MLSLGSFLLQLEQLVDVGDHELGLRRPIRLRLSNLSGPSLAHLFC